MRSEKKSYPPAEKLEKMISELDRMYDLPFPIVFRHLTRKPENWPQELQRIYKVNRSFFKEVKGTLPNLTYDEMVFLKRELRLVKETNVAIGKFKAGIVTPASDQSFIENFVHLLHKLTPLGRPLRCYVPNEEGIELISYYRKENMPDFYHLLFLKFLSLRTPLFAVVLQHPITLNLGKSTKLSTARNVERAFDRIIKPHFGGREETSTESVNIRRWLQYFRILFEFDKVFHFDIRRFKILLVGAVCRFLNKRFAIEGPAIRWQVLNRDLTEVTHLDPDIVDIEELVGLILDVNGTLIRWIPSERGEMEFRRHKGKQVLELLERLTPPKTEIIEGSDFLKMPSIPQIENVDLIKPSRLDEFWRKTS